MSEKIVSFEEFQKMDLRIGKITKAEPVPQSRNLIKMIIDIGGESRQAMAGIAQHYSPKDLEGKHGVAITDHNTLQGAQKLAKKSQLTVIPGLELAALGGHPLAPTVKPLIP